MRTFLMAVVASERWREDLLLEVPGVEGAEIAHRHGENAREDREAA
jgi:hypothetical protein